MIEKYNQKDALRLNFLISVPLALAAITIDILFGDYPTFGLPTSTLIVCILVSFVVGYLTIKLLLRVAKKIQFGYFCIVYGFIAFVVILPFMVF